MTVTMTYQPAFMCIYGSLFCTDLRGAVFRTDLQQMANSAQAFNGLNYSWMPVQRTVLQERPGTLFAGTIKNGAGMALQIRSSVTSKNVLWIPPHSKEQILI